MSIEISLRLGMTVFIGMVILTPSDVAQAQATDEELLAFVNHCTTTVTVLENDVGLPSQAASNIAAHRDGPDGLCHTGDDDPFDTLEELDAVPYVGTEELDLLRAYAESWQPPAPVPALRGSGLFVVGGLIVGVSLWVISSGLRKQTRSA